MCAMHTHKQVHMGAYIKHTCTGEHKITTAHTSAGTHMCKYRLTRLPTNIQMHVHTHVCMLTVELAHSCTCAHPLKITFDTLPPHTSLNVMCRFIFTHVHLCTREPPYACSHTGAQGCVIYKHTVTYTMSIHLYTHKCLHIQGCTFMQVAAHTLARIHGGSHTGLCTPMHT